MSNNKKIKQAREALKAVHNYSLGWAIVKPVVVPFKDHTLLISENDFDSDSAPTVEVISNKDLLKLYGYAARCFNGDEDFDDFNGQLMNINGMDDVGIAFTDLFFALVRIDENKVCHVMDFEKYMNKQHPKLKLV